MAVTTVKMKLEGMKKFFKTTILLSLGEQETPYSVNRRLQLPEVSTEERSRRIDELTMANSSDNSSRQQPSFIRAVCDCLIVYVIGIYYVFKELFTSHRKPADTDGKCGQVAIVTGGSRGIGFEVVRQFLQQGMHVIIASSNTSSGCSQVKQLQEEFPNSTVEYQKLDLTSLKSIREFASEFLQRNLPLHVLVNNAGIMFGPQAQTKDGFESQLGINYIGHFYLTYLLLSQLEKTGTRNANARIINVSSCCHFAGRIKIGDLNSRDYYSPYGCYGQSKLAQVMFTMLLQKYFIANQHNVTVNAVHPGVVDTQLYRHTMFNFLPLLTRLLFKSAKQGADGVVHVALSNELEGVGGNYYENCYQIEQSKTSQDKLIQLQLWQETCNLLRIKDFHPPLDS